MRSICTAIVATLALVGTSFAATIHVPGDYALIQDAINASSNGDVINIAAGTYIEHNLNPGGKAITIGSASGDLDVTINAQQSGRVFIFHSGEGEDTALRNLVLTGGSSYYGAGIYCSSSSPTISNCTISGCTANSSGGGMYNEYSSPTITDCTFTGCSADWQGGGMYNHVSNPTLINCTFTGNMSTWDAGGMSNIYGSPTLYSCTFSENIAQSDGGGMANYQNSSPNLYN